jgi:hypothetical protein
VSDKRASSQCALSGAEAGSLLCVLVPDRNETTDTWHGMSVPSWPWLVGYLCRSRAIVPKKKVAASVVLSRYEWYCFIACQTSLRNMFWRPAALEHPK